jgi:iron complex transport system substrate-binding protein
MMRAIRRSCLAAICLALAATPACAAAPAKPKRIMSISLCNDLILLMLVPRDRIASITWLSKDAIAAVLPGAARGIALNHGNAEEVLAQKPDLIVATPWTTPQLRRLIDVGHVPIVEVGDAGDFAAIRGAVRTIGAAVGEPARAEALVRGMDAELARLAAERPARPRRVVAWNGAGSVPAAGSLPDAIIRAAGAINIAADRRGGEASTFGPEELLAARPDAILQGVGRWSAPSLEEDRVAHPVIRSAYAGRRITYSDALFGCGLPQSARAAADLRRALAALPPGPVRW